MVADDFSFNPCRRNIFDVFPIDKSQTDLKAINEKRRNAREQWQYGQLVARDGAKLTLSEAELNAFESLLLDPVERLKAEQFVHQAHRFSQDEELAACLQQLKNQTDLLPELLADLQAAILARLSRFLPPLAPPRLPDDLPWPAPPEPLDLLLEPLEAVILRDE